MNHLADDVLRARLRASISRAPRFRDISGYAGIYAVTEEGRVWAHERRWTTGCHGNIRRHRPAGWMRLQVSNHGYLVVNLKNGARAKTMQVHRLVARAFLANPLNLPAVNHRNLRRTDNHVRNLEWSTHGDNKRHSALAHRRYGRFAHITGLPAANNGAFQ